MTTYAELATAISVHVAGKLSIPAYDFSEVTPDVPCVIVHPGGHAAFIDQSQSGIDDQDVNFALITLQAAQSGRDALHTWYGWAHTMRTAFDDFTVADGDVYGLSILRVLEPRPASTSSKVLFAGQFDVSLTLSTC